jgi:integrase
MASHEILGRMVQVYKRSGRHWQCSASIDGRQYRVTTKEEELPQAKQFAEDWYLGLRGKARAGILKKREKTFRDAAQKFEEEYTIITEGQRSPKWVEGHKIRLRLHLTPFFGDLGMSEVTAGKVQEYRVHRIGGGRPLEPPAAKPDANGAAPLPYKPPARSTLHDEIVTLRQVLKTAIRHGWLAHLPDLTPPYKTQGKIVHRPWFSPAEYKQLYEATRDYARTSHDKYYKWNAEQVHDYVLFMANTGVRPDEAKNLQHRDVTIVNDDATGERILEIEVRGKRGIGFCKSMPSAVRPYQRLLGRAKPLPRGERKPEAQNGTDPKPTYPELTDPVFPGNHIKLFNGVLRRAKLKLDRDNNPRTAYSLRHTYICMRLMEGADIYQIAKNCRTSVEMIEKFYAAHIKNTLDAAAINVMRQRRPLAATEPSAPKVMAPRRTAVGRSRRKDQKTEAARA